MTQLCNKVSAGIPALSPALIAAALITAASMPAPASGQSYETGGIQLTFGVLLSASAEDNRALDSESAGNSTEGTARLSLGLLSETRTQRLALDLNGKLQALDTPDGSSQGNGFADPGLSLSYDRNSIGASLGLSAYLRESELSQDYLDEDGLDFVTGTATRRLTGAEASLNWGEDSPLGFGTFARIQDTTYSGGTASGLGDTALDDNRRRTLGASLRMDLDKVRQLNLSLTRSDFEQDSVPGRRETLSLDTSVTQDLLVGTLTGSLNVTGTEDGERYTALLGRSRALPLGALSGQIGLTRSTSGDTYLSGGLDLSRTLERGALTLGVSRTVASSDTDDNEVLRTRASLGLTQELTPLSGIRLGVNLSRSEETADGAQTTSADFGVTYNHDLPSDWTFATGYTHRVREEDSEDAAHSNRIFLQLQRNFVTRF